MFSEREQHYLKALVVSALETLQREDFKKLSPPDINNSITECLDDYFAHFPLTNFSDTDQ